MLNVKEIAQDCYHDAIKNIIKQNSILNNNDVAILKQGLNPKLDPFVFEIKEIVKEKLLEKIHEKIADEFELAPDLHLDEKYFLEASFFNFIRDNYKRYDLNETEIDVVCEFFNEYIDHKVDFYIKEIDLFIDHVSDAAFETNISYSSSKDFDMENYSSNEVLPPLLELIGYKGDLNDEDRKEIIEDLLEGSQEYLDSGVVKFFALNGVSLDSLSTNEKFEKLIQNNEEIKTAIDCLILNIDNTDHITPVFINKLGLRDIVELSIFEQLNHQVYLNKNNLTSVFNLSQEDIVKLEDKLQSNGFEVEKGRVNLHCSVYGRTIEFNDYYNNTGLLVKNITIPFNYFKIGNDFLGNYGYSPQDVVQGNYFNDSIGYDRSKVKLVKIDSFNKNLVDHFLNDNMKEFANLAIKSSKGLHDVLADKNKTIQAKKMKF